MRNKSNDRARQFMPFDSLKGFKEAIKNKEKIIVAKKELSEDSEKNLEYKIKQIQKGMIIKVIYYEKDHYVAVEGMVSSLDIEEKKVMIVKTLIFFKDIYDITGETIMDLED